MSVDKRPQSETEDLVIKKNESVSVNPGFPLAPQRQGHALSPSSNLSHKENFTTSCFHNRCSKEKKVTST